MMAYSYGKLKSYICLDLFTFLHENVTMDCKCWAALWTYLRGLALKIISGDDTPPSHFNLTELDLASQDYLSDIIV